MAIAISAISNPHLSCGDGRLIDVVIVTEEYGPIPCSLHPDDTVLYSFEGAEVTNGQLFERAKRGDFGPLA